MIPLDPSAWFGAPGGTRTPNQPGRNRMLYPLSYKGVVHPGRVELPSQPSEGQYCVRQQVLVVGPVGVEPTSFRLTSIGLMGEPLYQREDSTHAVRIESRTHSAGMLEALDCDGGSPRT
jgi:hypothetical protein